VASATTSLPPLGNSSWSSVLSAPEPAKQPLRSSHWLSHTPHADWRACSQREHVPEAILVSRCARSFHYLLDQPRCLLDLSGLPGSLRGEQECGHGPRLVALPFEDPFPPFLPLLVRRRHLQPFVCLGQEYSRFSFQRRSPSHSSSRNSSTVLAARAASSGLKASSAVLAMRKPLLNCLVRNVSLGEVVEQTAGRHAQVFRRDAFPPPQHIYDAMTFACGVKLHRKAHHARHRLRRSSDHHATLVLLRAVPHLQDGQSRPRHPFRQPALQVARVKSFADNEAIERISRSFLRQAAQYVFQPPLELWPANHPFDRSVAAAPRLQAPVWSLEIPPESSSERTSSFVKNGLPSVPS